MVAADSTITGDRCRKDKNKRAMGIQIMQETYRSHVRIGMISITFMQHQFL
jgi:hypothetical protein